MIVTDGKCRILPGLQEETFHPLCDGCSVHLCADCRRWDLWGYGCGHVDTKAFCASCYENPSVNPYGGNHGEQ